MVQFPIPMRGEPARPIPLSALFPVIREVLELTGSFILTVTGSSMEPFLRHLRDCATFCLPDGRPIRRGDIVLFRRDDGAFVLHRVYRVARDGAISTVGDAQWTLEEGIRPDQLLACVTQVERNGHTIDCEKGAWRAIMTAYMLARMRIPNTARALLRALRCVRHPISACRAVHRKLRRSREAAR